MFDWLCKLLHNAQARRDQAAAALEQLAQQAHVAREQLNASLLLAHTASHPETRVAQLALAKAQLAQLQAIAAQHPRMHVHHEAEVASAIQQLEQQFSRAGYYAMADARRKQHASVHVQLSPQSEALLRSTQQHTQHSPKG